MGIFNFFRSKPKGSATTAKDRLQVLIAHERTDRDGPDYLPLLKKDILEVIKKYVDIGEEQVVVQLDSQDNCEVLELNITLPEEGSGSLTDDKDRTRSRSARIRANQTRAGQVAAAGKKPGSSRQAQARPNTQPASNTAAEKSSKSSQRKGRETV